MNSPSDLRIPLEAGAVTTALVYRSTAGDAPAALILGQYRTPETVAALEHKLGLDLPLPVQY